MADLVSKFSKGVGDALSAVMLALLELPRFETEQYFRLLAEVLAALPEGVTVGEALERYAVRFPPKPLAGEVRARLEAALVEDLSVSGGVRLALPGAEGRLSGSGSFDYGYGRRAAGAVAVEIAARYMERQPFDLESLRDLTAADLLKLASSGKPPEGTGAAS